MLYSRLALSFTFSVALIACAHDGENPVEPPAINPPPVNPPPIQIDSGQLRVSIDVAGDARLGDDTYTFRFDSKSLSVPVDTGTVIETSAGRHWIDFGYAEDRIWCSVIGAGSQVADVTKGELTNVQFKIDCPALDGTGTLILRVEDYTAAYCLDNWPICGFEARHGTEKPTITLERINGTPITLTVNVAMWNDVEIPLDAGTYRITTTGIPGCSAHSDQDASLHDGKSAHRDIAIVCY